ncbi:hypothetical protein KI688_007107 [Linnemannia hyalina]|uniref:Uncharacterized protein n=1 Tax=Linnemannia hyalina TaxID=64524 RepID=A0A9P7XKB1_9FUNG|nr:hypothetical protein KI688_007107 [Linnemannia hyalina]
MSLFKSTKNQSASAAASPAQTPRPSVDAQRPAAQTTKKMTTEQALDSVLHKAVQTMPSISTVMTLGRILQINIDSQLHTPFRQRIFHGADLNLADPRDTYLRIM